MIEFKNQGRLVANVTENLLNAALPACWCVVIPPGFGEAAFSAQLTERLREHVQEPLVAVLPADVILDSSHYMKELARQWGAPPRAPLPPGMHTMSARLDALLSSLPEGRPAVQIVTHFHKILERLDSSVLGALRAAEQAHVLRTVTISPLPYDELKKRWKRGHILVTSDYGDTHLVHVVEPLGLEAIMPICDEQRVPRDVSEAIFAITGGYPEPFEICLRKWISGGRRAFVAEEFEQVAVASEPLMRRMVRHLDPPGDTLCRDHIVNLYQGHLPAEAYNSLSRHPWRSILLNETGLKAEAVGRAAVAETIQEAIDQGSDNVSFMMDGARRMYRRRQYSAALRILEKMPVQASAYPAAAVLKANAGIMSELYGGPGNRSRSDISWIHVKRLVASAKESVARHRGFIKTAEKLAARYNEIAEVANAIAKAQKCDRYVDTLSGLQASEMARPNYEATVMLLLLNYETGCAISSDNGACQAVLPLPEQAFRVWAFWALGLNLDRLRREGISNSEEVWRDAEDAWENLEKKQGGSLKRDFSSFKTCAYYCLASFFRTHLPGFSKCPSDTFEKLRDDLNVFDSVRRGSAHAICICSAKQRERYFELISRWIDAVISACPSPQSREAFLAPIQPLPLVEDDGTLKWPG